MAALDPLLGRRDGEELHLDASWTNSWGAVFGGALTAALLDRWISDLAAEADEVDAPPLRLRSAHLSFDRPARVDAPLRVDAGEPTGGRSVRRLDGRVHQRTPHVPSGDDRASSAVRATGPGAVEPMAVRDETGASGRTLVHGFAVAARGGGVSTPAERLDPAIPPPDRLEEAPGDGRTADVIRHHFELRVVPRLRGGEPVIRQWVRIRHLRGVPPLAAVGLLADLVSVGVFRTASRHLEALQAVSSLDLGLQLTGAPLGEWTLLTMATPPITDGGAVAHATLHALDGAHLATVAQQVLVRPLAP